VAAPCASPLNKEGHVALLKEKEEKKKKKQKKEKEKEAVSPFPSDPGENGKKREFSFVEKLRSTKMQRSDLQSVFGNVIFALESTFLPFALR
jgi:hypothetical protein